MPATIEEFTFTGIEDACRALAADLAACLRDAADARGRASLALSGGRTPRALFPLLAGEDVPWRRVHLTLTDERWVDAGDRDSNERLVRDWLLAGLVPAPQFTGLKTPAPSPLEAIAQCEARLEAVPRPFDAVFLGLGPDGHIASLFPGGEGWLNAPGRVAATPGADHPRMSLTPRALLDSRAIHLLLSGADKKRALRAARAPGPVTDLPLRLILHQDAVPVRLYIAD